MSRLIAVSNRVSVPTRGAPPGGLAVGLMAAMQTRGGLWFGWNGETTQGLTGRPELAMQGNVGYLTTSLEETEYRDFHLGFCNSVLWPLFHYFIGGFRYSDVQYDAFQRVNRRFAMELAPELRDDDVIWVHDYHLIPMAQKLRDVGARQPIGFFLHIPFPNFEVLRVLPVHAELLQFLLAYDVLGFQTETDLNEFRFGIRQIWPEVDLSEDFIGFGGRRVVTLVCPIGVDRLDCSKGLVQRFRAYERFLETHPENRNRVTFMQIAPLSRNDVRAYSEIVTPLRDGMNLVAKEFVAAQDPADPGVLVLSSLAGAARELDAAVLVNPYDSRGVAHAIQLALSMPLGERRERHQSMVAALRRNFIHAWHGRFVGTLARVAAAGVG